ncbi:MAG: phosphotransferase [Nitrospirae bacterium]|nr:phosphotransferase [Nitrospirota bacterium]
MRDNKYKLTAFLPAAGLGERLMPITYHKPKPLLPILGKPIIEGIIERFSLVSSGRIGINLHYKADMMKDWVRNSPFSERIKLFYEDPILGTGGALKNAERFFLNAHSDGHFLVHNADIISNIDLSLLIETHLSEGNIATLAVHDFQRYNNVILDDKGYVINVENPGASMPNPDTTGRKRAYTGIALYSTKILRFLPKGVSHATIAWLAAAGAGHKVKALDFTGCCWTDIGTPLSYATAIIDALRADGETIYIHPSVKNCSNTEMDGYIAIEKGCVLDNKASLNNCIVFEGSRPEAKRYEDCIIGPDFEIQFSETEMLGADENLIHIGTGGSNREYYRMRKDGSSAVLVKYQKGDPDFCRNMDYTRLFRRYQIPVPELLESDFENMTAIFEDLGDLSLYGWLKCKRDKEEIEAMYKRVMDILSQIHMTASWHISECPNLAQRVFDYDYFRWETGYFQEWFIKGVCKITAKNPAALDDEFHRLALKADSFPKTLIHRDFQSQNIMIRGGAVRIIDYQGARLAPPAYDVVSILWDPYHRLEDDLRERLLDYYRGLMTAKENGIDKDLFMNSIPTCRIQRHMQALGAYGFLSIVKGKGYFLRHVEEGVRLLKDDILNARDDYPEIYRLANNI